jgi:hypothetical protein
VKNVLNESSEEKCNTFYAQYVFSASFTVFEIKKKGYCIYIAVQLTKQVDVVVMP